MKVLVVEIRGGLLEVRDVIIKELLPITNL
jgi:hypothetical protein